MFSRTTIYLALCVSTPFVLSSLHALTVVAYFKFLCTQARLLLYSRACYFSLLVHSFGSTFRAFASTYKLSTEDVGLSLAEKAMLVGDEEAESRKAPY
jgi:hypothetical protein